VEPGGTARDTWWAVGWLAFIMAAASSVLVVLLGPPLHLNGSAAIAAVLAFVGVLVTAAASIIGLTVTRRASRDTSKRLRLDAAMRAGKSFTSHGPEGVDQASIASSLLALTKLDNADLAVVLLVDFWSPHATRKVSDEAAILVVDAALRSQKRNAQLVAAELLCRNAERLNPCQSLHWPSCIDGCWNHNFGPKTKLLLVDALTLMTKASKPATENALRSIAVRLYGIYDQDRDLRVKGCVATLIDAVLPALCNLGYTNFMQGNREVMLKDLEVAAGNAKRNADDFLARIVKKRCNELREWASACTKDNIEEGPGALATATANPVP
jgi:hypothetical protein